HEHRGGGRRGGNKATHVRGAQRRVCVAAPAASSTEGSPQRSEGPRMQAAPATPAPLPIEAAPTPDPPRPAPPPPPPPNHPAPAPRPAPCNPHPKSQKISPLPHAKNPNDQRKMPCMDTPT